MKTYLSKYPTTLEYDIEYLSKYKKKMDFNEYNCYIIRIGEKKILNYYLNMANDILQLLNTNKDDIKKIFQNIIIAAGSQISVENGSNSLNNLLKYKSYLSYILPLSIIK